MRCRSARRTSRCSCSRRVLLAGLGWFLRHHRMGIAIRAAADDPDTARLEGIPARWMATLAWAIAGGIAAFSAILVTPTTAGAGIEGLGPDLLLKGLAGAVIARMSSIPIAHRRLARHRRDRAAPALQPRHPRPGHRRDRADHRGRAAAPAAARPLRPGQGPLAPRRAAAAARASTARCAASSGCRGSSVAIGIVVAVGARLRRQQRHRLGAHAGRRLHAGRPQRRPAHRCLRPALARPVRVRRHRRGRVGPRRRRPPATSCSACCAA